MEIIGTTQSKVATTNKESIQIHQHGPTNFPLAYQRVWMVCARGRNGEMNEVAKWILFIRNVE